MSFLFNCCSQNEEGDYNIQDIEIEAKDSGRDRILRLSQQEYFPDYTKYFQNEGEKNIFENESSTNDFFNLNLNNQMFTIKNSNICMFCGGQNCKYEDPNLYDKCAIQGLISDLFYDCIYASQRPSTTLIKKYDLINSFKRNNIKLIVNCEIHGEHPNCGPNKGLEFDSGYSYSPSLFISEGIDVLNCGFEEMTAPFTLDFMIDVVKKISYIIKYKHGRVLVHCHSGNGRTCLVIVCFLIYYFNLSAEQAINEVRKKREKAIGNDSQDEYVHKFEIYCNILKDIFTERQISIENHIKHQIDLDYNFNKTQNIPNIISMFFENKNLENEVNTNINNISSDIIDIRYIPNIILICLDKIIQIKNKEGIKNENLYPILNGLNQISKEESKEISLIKREININNWQLLLENENLSIITEILFNWMNESVVHCINPKKIEKLWNKGNQLFNNNIQNSTPNNDFDEFMKGNSPKSKSRIIQFTKLFILIFSKTECEIIKYISIFLRFIYPIVTKEKMDSPDIIREYKRFIYKFCLFLLGYNLDKVNALSDKKNLREMNDVKRFILILEFFIFYSTNEEKPTSQNYFNNDWLSNYLKLKAENEETEIKNMDDDILLFLNKKPKLDLISVKYFFIADNK